MEKDVSMFLFASSVAWISVSALRIPYAGSQQYVITVIEIISGFELIRQHKGSSATGGATSLIGSHDHFLAD